MKHKIYTLHLSAFCLLIFATGMIKTTTAQVKIGVFSDCQYCDCEKGGNRYYQNSLKKLDDCIADFNQDKSLAFVAGLGDLIDRDFSSFEKVNLALAKSGHSVYQVSGNHDYSVKPEYLTQVTKQLGLKDAYYSVEHKNWKFIFLNGNDITLSTTNTDKIKLAETMLAQLTENEQPNNKTWNGGIGKTQLLWLETELKSAEERKQKVVLFCHYPLLPLEVHALWNSVEVLAILGKYNCVKAWINGHNHAGNYAMKKGVHFITLKGMVDTPTENAYAFITLSDSRIKIDGKGREQSRDLPLK